MFRKLNKKGFTLVELMIVVVILGILVAIAVPIYGAVTESAKRKTCMANMRMIESALAQYHVNMGGFDTITSTNNGDLSADGHSITDMSHAEGLPDEIVHWFDDGVPGCPIDGNTYTVTRIDETVIKIECVGDEGHGEFRH